MSRYTAQHRASVLGFTLIEMVVSLSILSIVFLAMGSVMLISTKAVPDADAPASQVLGAAEVLEQMASELQVATSIIAVTDKAIMFTVPDRDDDSQAETIAYLWNAGPGNPLLRQINGGDTIEYGPGVYGFELTYQTHTVTPEDELIESNELLLYKHHPQSATLGELSLGKNQLWGQHFVPGLPADTVSWSVTRVLCMARRDGIFSTYFGLQMPTADYRPNGTSLGAIQITRFILSDAFQWVQVQFSGVTGLSPDTGLCLTFTHHIGPSMAVQYVSGGVTEPGLYLSEGKPDWQKPSTDKALLFYVYGKYIQNNAPEPYDVLRSVSMQLNTSEDLLIGARTKVATLNQPIMP